MPPHRLPREESKSDNPGQAFSDALAVSLRFLSYRPRTVQEVRRRLTKDFAEPTIEATLAHLLKCGLLDDAAFAVQWRNSRERRRPKGRKAIALELRRLGIDQEVIDSTLEELDETAGARKAALKPATRLVEKGCTHDMFRKRIGDLLLRRGFNYGTAIATVEELWQELTQD